MTEIDRLYIKEILTEIFYGAGGFCPANVETFDPCTDYHDIRLTYRPHTCATAIVGTWVERLNVCRTESASMCRSLFETGPVKNVNNQNVQEN